jgi:hypothetical protein
MCCRHQCKLKDAFRGVFLFDGDAGAGCVKARVVAPVRKHMLQHSIALLT